MARPKHGYELDGEPVPGTTTICGLLNKPALVGWAGKTCTEAAWKLGKAGEPMPRWGEILYPKRDDAASAGTLVHELFEAHLRGLPLPELPDSPVGKAAQRGFDNARRWLDGSALTIQPYEQPLVSPTYRFGGTPDALATHRDGVVSLADWKTSKSAHPEMVIQMAAYRQLLTECAGLTVTGVHLVLFSREYGDFQHRYVDDDALDEGWTVFKSLLALNHPYSALQKRIH